MSEHSSSLVDNAVYKSADRMRRKKPAHKFTEEDKKKFKQMNDERRKSLRHFSAFSIDDVRATKDGSRVKICMADNKTKITDPKSLCVISLAPFEVRLGSDLIKEGNAGKGDNPTKRGDAKRSLGLVFGQADKSVPMSPKLKKEQEDCAEKVRQAARAALGRVFDTYAREATPAAMTVAENSARMKIQQMDKLNSIEEVNELEMAEDGKMAARVKELARAEYIANGKIPFVASVDPKTKKKNEPMAWVESKVYTLETDNNQPISQDREKGPPLTLIPTTTENMPRIIKLMKAVNYVPKKLVYEARDKKTHNIVQLQHPVVMVPDLDEMGNKIIGPNGQPVMVPIPSLDWNPLFEGRDKEDKTKTVKLSSLVQVDVLLSFTDGGKKGNYGIKLLLYGAIKITGQALRTEQEKYEYDEGDNFNTGLWGDDDGDAQEDADEQPAAIANASAFSSTSVVGLPGVVSAGHKTNGANHDDDDDDDDDDVPPEERQYKRKKTQ